MISEADNRVTTY